MKNKRIEKMLSGAREHVKTALRRNTYDTKRKIVVYHMYDGDAKRDISYWDDVSFKFGGYYIAVCWTHPRYEYMNQIEDLAYKLADTKFGRPDFGFDDSTKNYKKVGKSRKKIISYTLNNLGVPDGYYEYQESKVQELSAISDTQQSCKFEVILTNYSRLVNICCPMEVRDEDELKTLADFVRDCLLDHSLFEKTFGNYSYTKEEWIKENP